MKVTTVRLSEGLWRTISTEAEIAGVSASEFIREAALARAAAAAGARGQLPFPTFEGTLDQARAVAASANDRELEAALTALSRAFSRSLRSDSQALRAESEQAKRNAERCCAGFRRAGADRDPTSRIPTRYSTSRIPKKLPAIAPAPLIRPSTRVT